jgi:hypothetical protein
MYLRQYAGLNHVAIALLGSMLTLKFPAGSTPRVLITDRATWYSTHTSSTLPRFNCENGVMIKILF